MKRLLILADDFSGATEIAGISHNYGLKTIICPSVQIDGEYFDDHQVIVIDTGTRNLSNTEVSAIYKTLIVNLQKITQDFSIFKKVDSVMRGHILLESQLLSDYFKYKRVVIMAANPSKDRIIKNGKYFIKDQPLQETSFKSDPFFPIHTNEVEQLLLRNQEAANYFHFKKEEEIPAVGFLTTDLENENDHLTVIKQMSTSDLICGGGDAYYMFLKHHGFFHQPPKALQKEIKYRIILNGSTIINEEEKELLDQSNFISFSITKLIPDHPNNWQQIIADQLHQNNSIYLSIGKPFEPERSLEYLKQLTSVIFTILAIVREQTAHFYLTGGDTSRKIIELLKPKFLFVHRQLAEGVVTVQMPQYDNYYFTVKPGSYPWGVQEF